MSQRNQSYPYSPSGAISPFDRVGNGYGNVRSNSDSSIGKVATSTTRIISRSTTDDTEQMNTEAPEATRNVGWIMAAFTMFKTQVGIGVLSIPSAFNKIGLVGGVVCLLLVHTIALWLGYQIGQAGLRHPDVRAFDDVGQKLFGRWGRLLFGTVYWLYFIFVGASAVLGISIALGVLTNNSRCALDYFVTASCIAWILASIKSVARLAPLSIVGAASIGTSLAVLTIALIVRGRPETAPSAGPWVSDYELVKYPTFTEALSAVSCIVFAYSGVPAFFTIHAQMREPKHYNRAMFASLSGVFTVYATVGIIVYIYCGSHVSSPALGSAGGDIEKVCYGIAIVGLCVTACLLCHYPTKQTYSFATALIQKLGPRNDPQQAIERTFNHRTSTLTWYSSSGLVALTAFLIASGIPNFSELVSLVGALLGAAICFPPLAFLWLKDHWSSEQRTRKFWLKVVWHAFVIAAGVFMMCAGTYAAVGDILHAGQGRAPFSCAPLSQRAGSSE